MKKIILFFSTILLAVILNSISVYSEENTETANVDYRKDMHLSLFASADYVNNTGLNTTIAVMNNIEIYHNKYIPISAFYELNVSIPVIKDSTEYFSCINAGLKFTRIFSDSWSLGLDFGSGIAVMNKNYSLNSTVRVNINYQSISLIVKMQSILTGSGHMNIQGLGLGYSF